MSEVPVTQDAQAAGVGQIAPATGAHEAVGGYTSEHLDCARGIASYAGELGHSPDARSTPLLLGGILHALIAIAENGADQ